MPAKQFDFEKCKAETLMRNYKKFYSFRTKSNLIRINAAKAKKYLTDEEVIKTLEDENEDLNREINSLKNKLSEVADIEEIQKFRDHTRKTLDENYDLRRRVDQLEKKLADAETLRNKDSDLKSLRSKITEIDGNINFVLKYHEDYKSLVYNLNKILELREKIKILDDKTIDNQILQSLQVIRAIRKFNSINKEIWDCVQIINKEYKSLTRLTDEDFNYYYLQKSSEKTYADVYNIMISRVFYLHDRLFKVSDFCKNILFATGIDFACEKQFYFIHGDRKCELNFRGAIGFINSLCDIKVDEDHEVVHNYMNFSSGKKYSFDTSNK